MATTVPDLQQVQEVFNGRFRISGPLRLGGQALVLRATQPVSGSDTEQDVALKLYLDSNQDERVLREIEAASRVRHLTLANLLEHGTVQIGDRRFRYLAWEFIPGTALDSRLASTGPVAPKVCAVVGRDVATAIEAIWARRIVHRDVNPKNIMLRAGDQGAVLIDLGIAKYIDSSPLTGPGLTWGTAGYLSPEQMSGLELTCQSDIFSLGISLQQALTGNHPTNYDQRALRYGGPRTEDLHATAPARFAGLLDRMVTQRPAHRPAPRMLIDGFTELIQVL